MRWLKLIIFSRENEYGDIFFVNGCRLVKNKKILDFIGDLGYSGEEEWWNLVGLIVIWDVLKRG